MMSIDRKITEIKKEVTVATREIDEVFDELAKLQKTNEQLQDRVTKLESIIYQMGVRIERYDDNLSDNWNKIDLLQDNVNELIVEKNRNYRRVIAPLVSRAGIGDEVQFIENSAGGKFCKNCDVYRSVGWKNCVVCETELVFSHVKTIDTVSGD